MSTKKSKIGTCYGTHHFKSLRSAFDYYEHQGYTKNDVRVMVRAGEIAIGKPSIPEGMKLLINTQEGRYFIAESKE